MDKAGWKKVDDRLMRSYTGATVKLLVDGYTLTIQRVRKSSMKDALMVFVNGEWKGKWISEDCEERRRFHRPVTRKAATGKWRKAMERGSRARGVGADFRNRCKASLNKTFTYYTPEWNSVASLKRHLVKHNKSIELIES